MTALGRRQASALGVAALILLACAPRVSAPRPEPSSAADAIYFVMVDRFANGEAGNDGSIDPADPAAFHGGDLQGLIDRLDHLQALGVRTVWLSPVFGMRTEKFFGHGAFHGYWTYQLNEVEPRFGTRALLRKLSDELHRRGMRLLLDWVVNHVGPDAPLLYERPEWFHREGALKDWSDPVQLTRHDVHGLPDLAQEREDVYAFLLDSALAWVREVKPDGFRLDAVKHVPLEFWARYNLALREAHPGLYLLGEMLDGDPRVLGEVARKGKFDAMFDFPLGFALVDVFCKDQPPSRLGAVLSSDRFYADPDSLVTLLDNHDLPRVMTQCQGDVERVRQALTLQLTARGTPSLLYGTEAGLTGAAEPHNRADMRFGEGLILRETIASLLELRSRHPALQRGVPLLLTVEEGLFAYVRVTPGEVALIAVNRREQPARLPLEGVLTTAVRWRDRAGAPLDAARLTLAPGSVLVALASPVSAEGFAALHRRALDERSGARKRRVEIELAGASDAGPVYLVGSSAELGAWSPEHALGPFDANGRLAVELPVGGVVELKLLARPEGLAPIWDEGENRVLFVQSGEGPILLRAQWRRPPR